MMRWWGCFLELERTQKLLPFHPSLVALRTQKDGWMACIGQIRQATRESEVIVASRAPSRRVSERVVRTHRGGRAFAITRPRSPDTN